MRQSRETGGGPLWGHLAVEGALGPGISLPLTWQRGSGPGDSRRSGNRAARAARGASEVGRRAAHGQKHRARSRHSWRSSFPFRGGGERCGRSGGYAVKRPFPRGGRASNGGVCVGAGGGAPAPRSARISRARARCSGIGRFEGCSWSTQVAEFGDQHLPPSSSNGPKGLVRQDAVARCADPGPDKAGFDRTGRQGCEALRANVKGTRRPHRAARSEGIRRKASWVLQASPLNRAALRGALARRAVTRT